MIGNIKKYKWHTSLLNSNLVPLGYEAGALPLHHSVLTDTYILSCTTFLHQVRRSAKGEGGSPRVPLDGAASGVYKDVGSAQGPLIYPTALQLILTIHVL